MPVTSQKLPKDSNALHQKIRGPSKEEIEAAVLESLDVQGRADLVECEASKTITISVPCLVFLLLGRFEVDGTVFIQSYVAYRVKNEESIKLHDRSAVVVISE